MVIQILALVILALVFLIGTIKPIHLGLLALAAAYGVGVLLGGQTFAEVTAGFPITILVLLLGITYLFTIAREAGIVGWIIQKSLGLVRGRVALIPWVFFLLAILLGSMGSPLACTSLAPVAMFFVSKKIDPVLLGLSVILGGSAGGFAPISLYGLITNGIATNSGIETNPMFLFLAAIGFTTVLMAIAFFLFGGRQLIAAGRIDEMGPSGPSEGWEHGGAPRSRRSELLGSSAVGTKVAEIAEDTELPLETVKLNTYQRLTLSSLAILIISVITLSVLELPVDVGVFALALAMLLTLVYPDKTKPALKGIDWSTIMLVGGIVTYVGVMEHIGSMDLLGEAAAAVDQPILAAFVLCLVGAVVSAFASTTGILGALIPLALPLMVSGDFTGYALIVALALSSSLVDATPFSTAGASSVASAPIAERPRMTRILLRWGFTMIPIAPLATVTTLVLPQLI